MNKRNLAIKISKHPLLREFTEDKTIPNSIVARLIVEELTEVQSDLLKSALGGVRRDKNNSEAFLKKYFVNNKIVYPYGQLDKLSDEEKQKYVDAVNNYVKAFQMQQQEKLKDQGEKLEDQVDDAVDKELEVDQGGDVGDAIETLSTLLGVGAGIAGLFPGTAQLFGAPLSTASDVLQATDIVNDITAGNTKDATKKLLAIAAANYAVSLLPGGITAKETIKQGSKTAAAQAAIRAGQTKVAQKVFNSGLPQYVASKFGKDVTEAGVQKAVEKLSQKAAGKAISGLGNELIERSAKYQKEVEGDKDGILEKGFSLVKGKAIAVAKALGFGNPFEDLPGYKQLGLEGEQEEVFIAFLKYLQRKKIIKEGLRDLFDILGRDKGILTDFANNEGKGKLRIFRRLLDKPEVLKFIKDNVNQIASTDVETEKEPTALARQELDIEPIAKKFGEYEYFEPLNDEQKKVMFKFIALLKRNKLFENFADRTSLQKTLKTLGVRGVGNMKVLLQYMTEEEQETVQNILRNPETGVDKFLAMLEKAELVPAEKTGEEEKEEKPGEKKKKEPEEIKGDPIDINAEFAPNFVKYANEFLNDFYRKKYRKDQGILLNNLIETLKAIVEDEDLAQAFGRVPDDEEKPKTSDETEEAPVQDEEEQQPISEQEDEGEKVEADKDELRNIRIGLRSFLRRVNKTKQFLKEFTDNAKSVVSTQYKKRFMQNLKEIQESIYRLALVLNKILDNKEELSEKKESETMKLWKEVQKKYNLAAQSVNSIKELVDTETPPNQLDSILTNDTYSALLSLVDYFPSVAPFGQGKQKRSDFKEYDRRFNKAIEMVKSDLQNVFNLMKTGEAGEESLQGARSGLKDFADAVASIFGVPSRFEDAKVKPEDSEGPALEGEPGAKEEPEEKKYSDEISEEDKELITAAINDHKDFYEIATEEYKKLSTALRRPTSQEKPVQEIMKKTEDLIRDLNRSRKLAKSWLKKVQSGQASQKFIDKLERILKSYIDKYDELANAEMRRDFSSVLDTDRKRLEKIRKLLDIARKYVTEKQSIYTIFQSILTGGEYLNAQGMAINPQPSLKLIRDSLKDADGKESERLTGDMNFKVDRMFSNIKNIFKGQLDLSQADFSGFKNIVGFLADKVSKASIKLRSKINEEPEEDEDIELEPSADDKLRARYENSLEEALKHMKDFVSVYLTFVSAMKKAEENELETLNALDEDFTVVKGQLALMDDRLNKVSIIFGRQISLENMKKFGFPPKGTEKPESTDDDDEQEDTDDEQDQENFDFNNVESIRNTLIYGQNKRRVEELKQLLMDDSAFDGNENLVKEYYEAFLLWYIMLYEREESVQNESFVQKMPQLIKQKIDDKKIDKALKKLRTINPKIYQTVEDFHKGLDPATITTFYKIFSLIFNNQPINIKIDKNFINTFSKKINPPKTKKKKETAEDFYPGGFVPDSVKEQIIANKLKPLIREMLNKGK